MSQPVAPPRLQPARYGLVAAVRDATADAERWERTVEWSPECPPANGTWPLCRNTNDASHTTKALTERADLQSFQSFTIWAGDVCSTLGGLTEDRTGRATRGLLNAQSRVLEAALQDGAADLLDAGDPNPFLRDGNVDDLSPGASSSPLVYALAALEEAIGDATNGAPAFILATVQTAVLWHAARALERVGNLLYTALGTVVVPGVGFSGANPAGTIDSSGATAYAYATTGIQLYLGPIDVLGDERTIDRAANTWEVRAERAALVTFDPCLQAGINVDLCDTFCVAGS